MDKVKYGELSEKAEIAEKLLRKIYKEIDDNSNMANYALAAFRGAYQLSEQLDDKVEDNKLEASS